MRNAQSTGHQAQKRLEQGTGIALKSGILSEHPHTYETRSLRLCATRNVKTKKGGWRILHPRPKQPQGESCDNDISLFIRFPNKALALHLVPMVISVNQQFLSMFIEIQVSF